jgi:integrase
MRKLLTDDVITALEPKRARYLCYDKLVPDLAVRVSPTRKTFVIVGRFGKNDTQTRRKLGLVGRMTLDQARVKARNYHLAKPSDKFETVAETYIRHIQSQRRAGDAERCIRREFIKRWGDKPIGSITKDDLLEVTDAAVKRGSLYAAHHAWSYASRLWNWAIARGIVDRSPRDRTKPSVIIGRKQPRQRVLTDDELRKLWKAAKLMGHPFGTLVQLLLATGQRKSEVALARRSVFDMAKKLWTVPSERYKTNKTHLVPLSSLAMDIIKSIPNGERLFDVKDFAAQKKALDVLMKDVPHFVIHDIRRTVRTRLSELKVRREVAELVIGHTKQGLDQVYDWFEFIDERREALTAWSERLQRIVTPDTKGISAR